MSQDAVKVAPDIYKVVLENDAVRVVEIQMKRGAKSAMHSHPKSVVYMVTNGKNKFTFPDGKSENIDLKAGEAIWLDPVSHSVENTGDEMRALLVELKQQ
jgi:quercetin dioxygenase-like cupin family protein